MGARTQRRLGGALPWATGGQCPTQPAKQPVYRPVGPNTSSGQGGIAGLVDRLDRIDRILRPAGPASYSYFGSSRHHVASPRSPYSRWRKRKSYTVVWPFCHLTVQPTVTFCCNSSCLISLATRAPIPPHHRARAAPAAVPRVDRAERRAFRGGARDPTRHRMRGRACRRARSRRCEGRQTRSSQRPPFELSIAMFAAHGPRRPTHEPDERSGDDNPAVWRGEDARARVDLLRSSSEADETLALAS